MSTPKDKSQAEILAEREFIINPLFADAIYRITNGELKVISRAAYAKGYAAGQAGQWIPVSERLPDDETTVLVSCQRGYVGPGHIDSNAWLLHGIGEPDTGEDPVTHWMPLPEPPTNP